PTTTHTLSLHDALPIFINDSFGRHAGDRLLQCIADRLKERFPDTEQLAHLGGGTFVCVNALREPTAGDLRTSHEDITRLFAQPLDRKSTRLNSSHRTIS